MKSDGESESIHFFMDGRYMYFKAGKNKSTLLLDKKLIELPGSYEQNSCSSSQCLYTVFMLYHHAHIQFSYVLIDYVDTLHHLLNEAVAAQQCSRRTEDCLICFGLTMKVSFTIKLLTLTLTL